MIHYRMSPRSSPSRLSCLADDEESARRRDLLSIGVTSMATTLSLGEGASAAQTNNRNIATSKRQSSSQAVGFDPSIPFSSARKYKRITLPSGLKIILVSDKRAYRAQFALSVGGAGQFTESSYIPGLAHLMEHMVLSSTGPRRKDFEDWLGDNEGASNAFTAYKDTCFYASCPPAVLSDALQRFAYLFEQTQVEETCRNATILAREVRRVDSELDFTSSQWQAYYLTKQFVNIEHPYSQFSAGSVETLERIPQRQNVSVSDALIGFFRRYYLPRNAALVVIGNQDLTTLERMVVPFYGNILAQQKISSPSPGSSPKLFPGAFLVGRQYKQVVLYRNKEKNDIVGNTLSIQWTLNLQWSSDIPDVSEVAFCLSQELGRKGPGSLYQYLLRRSWIRKGLTGTPRVSVPANVPDFQILKFEFSLTNEGVLRRSSVLLAIYNYLSVLRSAKLEKQLVKQYATVAKLHGYVLASRPPDAIELAIDAQRYGVSDSAAGSGRWYRFASERGQINALQRTLDSVLAQLSDPDTGLVIVTADEDSISSLLSAGPMNNPLPPQSSSKWLKEPITGGRFLLEDMMTSTTRVEQNILNQVVNRDEIVSPVINPLIPSVLKPSDLALSISSGFVTNAYELVVSKPFLSDKVIDKTRWQILQPTKREELYGLVLPRAPPEPVTGRCAFVFQLLSSRPARAGVDQAAAALLFQQSWIESVTDLVELGAPGGLAYDISFNKFGMRLCILGVHQTLPSYARRLARRLVQHAYTLLQGREKFSSKFVDRSVAAISRLPIAGSPLRKRSILSAMKRTTAYEAATEGIAFLRSSSSATSFAQGDLFEIESLMEDMQSIFGPEMSLKRPISATPTISDLIYRTNWKPSGICTLAGLQLVSDACGRVIR